MKRVGLTYSARLSPLYVFEAVKPAAVQTALRRAFSQWGMPQRLRVDNGQPWGNGGDLPTALALWVIGLGIEMIWNRPYRPQDNGVVERAHGTTKRWVEPQTCADLSELQQRLNRANYLQRAQYPYRQRKTRCQYYPSLNKGGISYERNQEQWQLERVDTLLAQGLWARRTDSDGKISIYGRNYSVGRRYARQLLCLRFEPCSRQWQAFDEQGLCLKSMPNRELSAETIQTLTVTRQKKRTSVKS